MTESICLFWLQLSMLAINIWGRGLNRNPICVEQISINSFHWKQMTKFNHFFFICPKGGCEWTSKDSS